MANVNSAKDEYFDSFAHELESKFHRLAKLTAHGGASGDYHEAILKGVLRNFLTSRYSVKTGFIYKDENNVSPQTDIIIVDENNPVAYIFQEDDFVVVMPEAVVAIVEVKSTLDQQTFKSGVDNLVATKKLFDYPTSVCAILFGFQGRGGSAPSKTSLDTWFKSQGNADVVEKFERGPEAILWQNNNHGLFRYNPTTNMIGDGEYYHIWNGSGGNNGWQLSMFLAMIVSACESSHNHSGPIVNLGKHQAGRLMSGTDKVSSSDEQFSFGEGMTVPTK
jgi:hypothetical protein